MAAKSFEKNFVARDKKDKFFRNFNITQNINVITIQFTLYYFQFSHYIYIYMSYVYLHVQIHTYVVMLYLKLVT